MIGVIRVFTTKNPEILSQHGKIIEKLYGIKTLSKSIPEQPLGIFDNESEQTAIPKIVQLGKELEEAGCQALVISCAADPGIEQLRKNVSIPVIGAGSAASLAALAVGQPVGVMGITENAPAVMEKLLGKLMVAYIRPEGVTNTTDLLTPSGREKGLQAARVLLEQGAKVIVLACTGFSTIGLAEVLRSELKTTVIDPVEAEGMFASGLYR